MLKNNVGVKYMLNIIYSEQAVCLNSVHETRKNRKKFQTTYYSLKLRIKIRLILKYGTTFRLGLRTLIVIVSNCFKPAFRTTKITNIVEIKNMLRKFEVKYAYWLTLQL